MSQLTITEALDIAKANQDGGIPSNVTTTLEKANTDLWKRIQEQPATYVMTIDEFAVFNYFQNRYENNDIAGKAISRFWIHFKGQTPASQSSSH